MASEGEGFTMKWRIENFWKLKPILSDSLSSPGFFLNKVGDIKWKLKLTPGVGQSFVLFRLIKETVNNAQGDIVMDIELSLLDRDESPLTLTKYENFKFQSYCFSSFVDIDTLGSNKDVFAPRDLALRWRMWPRPGRVYEMHGDCVALTRLGVEEKRFDASLERFSSLSQGQERTASIRSVSGETPHFHINIGLASDGKIEIDAIRTDGFEKSYNCKFFLLDAASDRQECVKEEVWPASHKVWTCYLNRTRADLMDNAARYLPKDVLCLHYEFISFTGVESSELDKAEYRCESGRIALPKSSDHTELDSSRPEPEEFELPTALKDDLMSMYQDRIFCDTKLRSATEIFPAHRNVLSVRSPVFRAMFTHDMKEKNSDCIDIPDLSSEIIRRMLLFLYTYTLEDLDWDNAKDLYLAADKYQIVSLKRICSSFLIKNVRTSNVCEILCLADVHQDSDLKSAMRCFIMRNDKEVFRSKEWKMFVNSNARLEAEIMSLKYI